MPLVEVEDLHVDFGPHEAVRGVSLSIAPGERFGVIGESGSGKSLTALAIAGLLPAGAHRSGTIRFEGADLPTTDREMARLRGGKIGMVFQEPMTALNPLMRAGDQIAEAVRLHVSQHETEARVAALLEEVGLEARHARRYPHELSGGQRQRVMIAIALSAEPELLICDEPTSALDLITQRRILDLLKTVCDRRNVALMFISHDLKAVSYLCDRITVLYRGAQLETATAKQLFASPQTDHTRELVAASKMTVRDARELITPAPLFEARNVTRIFTSRGLLPFMAGPTLAAVNDVSFLIGAGQSVALVGPSGCGKTTLARMIAGLDCADRGGFVLNGRNYGNTLRLPRQLRRDVSLVFQDPFSSFDPRQCVGDAVAEPLRLLPRLSGIEKAERVRDAVSEVGLDPDVLTRYPHEFSGGQRQRLAIARALVTRPSLVVLDEPVSALDLSLRGEVLALLAHLRRTLGLSYLLISHDLDLVRAVADNVMIMEAGRIVERGRPADVFNAPEHALTRALIAARLPEIAA